MSNQNLKWIPLTLEDIPMVVKTANEEYPDLMESQEVFKEKLSLFPIGCMKLVNEDNEFCGYGICHPWHFGFIPPLNHLLEEVPLWNASCLYIHDIVILKEYRNQSKTVEFLSLSAKLADQFKLPYVTLTAVHGTQLLWEKLGFEVMEVKPSSLLGYGKQAFHMIRKLE